MYRITMVTGTRAEYGLLRPVLRRLQNAPQMEMRLVVTGAHLAQAYGYTVQEIEADGFAIDARLDILSAPVPEGRQGTARRTALALQLFLQYFSAPENRPHAVLLLGDRYEAFAAGQAAALLDIPVVHISGGDVTQGADDDWFRHCLTKMAKLHFPSCEVYRQRLIRMGEQPATVFNVGGLGDENIRSMELLSYEELRAQLDFELCTPYALVTFHPETAGGPPAALQADRLLAALEGFPQLFLLFTAANADAGGQLINQKIQQYCACHPNTRLVHSLGTLRYLSAMKHATVVVGNSSSGVVETPSLGVPAVDIGRRQAGRETGENVLHCALETQAIAEALEKALSAGFAAKASCAKSPYNGGDTSGKITTHLAAMLTSGALNGPKEFYDGGAKK